jgi:tetratricopeptide (TPR) repeat protein
LSQWRRKAGVGVALVATLPATSLPLVADADAPPSQSAATNGASDATHESPLVAYAQEIRDEGSRAQLRNEYVANSNLRGVIFEMSRHPPPPDADCAHTLGAQRFAELYARLAYLHEELGDFEAMIQANKSAIACEPRVGAYHASIAHAYLTLGEIAEARAAAERANAISPDDVGVRNIRARIDFIQEHWADATARFRVEAVDPSSRDVYGDYSRCYLWLAQRRAGVRNPELPPRVSNEKSPDAAPYSPTDWPGPILETLQGRLSEADLVQAIRDDGSNQTRERLTEALYYVGELRLAEGDVESARRHFASVINLRVLNFVEYGMARAELATIRKPVAEAATRGTSAPPR